jgi:hypothetical protein
MMDLIGAKVTCASDVGQLDARFLPYHYDLREYVRLAVHVMRVCPGILTRWDFARFVRMASELCRYGVLACGHVMHLDYRALYEAYEHDRRHLTAYHSPECSICNVRFWGVWMHLCVIR